MAKTVILAEQTLEGFVMDETYGFYAVGVNPPPFTVTVGETYRVVWDGIEYEVTAQDASALLQEEALLLGNVSGYGLVGNDEPFIIGWNSVGVSYFALTDTEEGCTHTVAIYQVLESLEVTLKDHSGSDIAYPVESGIKLYKPDGTTKIFVDADSVPEEVETSVALDFSGGDMEVIPEEGKVFSKVAIPTPANLVAENIAEGVDIAGIIGTLAASASGGGNVNVTFTKLTTTSTTPTVEHNLGAVPDLVIFFNPSGASSGHYSIGYGISAALFAKLESNVDVCTNAGVGMWSGSFYTTKRTGSSSCIDVATSGVPIYSANSKSVTLGGGLITIQKSATYHLIAFSGLA